MSGIDSTYTITFLVLLCPNASAIAAGLQPAAAARVANVRRKRIGGV
jgi:hypothetical protein